MEGGDLLKAIENFKEDEEIPEILEQFFVQIAQTGKVFTTWDKIQKLFLSKLNKTVNDFYKSNPFQPTKVNKHCDEDCFEDMKNRLNELVLNMDDTPFTMQRLCELVTNPKINYTKCEKFMRGLEKNLLVVSPWKAISDDPCETLKLPVTGVMPKCIDHTLIPSPVRKLTSKGYFLGETDCSEEQMQKIFSNPFAQLGDNTEISICDKKTESNENVDSDEAHTTDIEKEKVVDSELHQLRKRKSECENEPAKHLKVDIDDSVHSADIPESEISPDIDLKNEVVNKKDKDVNEDLSETKPKNFTSRTE